MGWAAQHRREGKRRQASPGNAGVTGTGDRGAPGAGGEAATAGAAAAAATWSRALPCSGQLGAGAAAEANESAGVGTPARPVRKESLAAAAGAASGRALLRKGRCRRQ